MISDSVQALRLAPYSFLHIVECAGGIVAVDGISQKLHDVLRRGALVALTVGNCKFIMANKRFAKGNRLYIEVARGAELFIIGSALDLAAVEAETRLLSVAGGCGG